MRPQHSALARLARLTLAASIGALSGCASTVPAVLTAAVTPGSDAFACASSKLTALGYTVEPGSRDAGSVKATKRTGGGGDYFVTTVSATVFGDAGAQKLRVNSDLVHYYDGGRQTQALGSTGATKKDAQAVIDACAGGA